MAFSHACSEPIKNDANALVYSWDYRSAFERNAAELHWLAQAILCSQAEAEACLAEALLRADETGYVARDWLDHWIKRDVVRMAIDKARPEIQRCAAGPQPMGRAETSFMPLDAERKRTLRSIPPDEICRKANAFERAALILHGYLAFSSHDCALLIGCPGALIEPVCARAFEKIYEESNNSQESSNTRSFEGMA